MIPPHVTAAFLRPLLAMFGQPSSDEPEVFLAEIARHLRAFSAEELREAGDHLVRTHKGPARWPKPAECIEACEHARERTLARRPPKDTVGESWRMRSNAAERAMIDSEMGQDAAREGWANGLREFLMAKRRFPHDHEVQTIKRDSAFAARCAAGTIDMGMLHKALLPLAGQMVKRSEDIAERVSTGVLRSDT